MRVNYVTPAQVDMPAVRYRMLMPGEYLGDYEISMVPKEADIHVFCKPYHQDPYLLSAYKDMASRLTYIFDICDDVFERDGPVPQYMKDMAHGASVVTTPTEVMRDRIIEVTGVEPVVIPDPYEFEEAEIKDITDKRVMWFGSQTNFDILKYIETDIHIELVCKGTKAVKNNLGLLKFPYTFTEWSMGNMKEAFDRNNVVIIPTFNGRNENHNYLAKSPNRVIESIRNGMAIVAAPIPSYLQFADYITLDWDVIAGLDNVKPLAKEAQKYVRDNFNISIIGEQWKQLFRTILSDSTWDAEQRSSKVG